MLATIKGFEHGHGLSLESQMARLNLEAFSLGNVISSFKATLPTLTDTLKTQFTSLVNHDDVSDQVKDAKLHFGRLKVKLPYASYLNYSKTLISVPEGFKGDLLAYAQALNKMGPEIYQEANKTLGEYNFVLSSFITNKENKISLKDHTDLFVRVKQRRERLTEELNHFFKAESNLSKQYLGDAVGRFADLETLVSSVDKLRMEHQSANVRDISEAVKKSIDLLQVIVEDTEKNGIAQVSGNAAMNISQGAYELGKYVEFVSIYRFRIEQMVSTIRKLVTKLEEVI